MIKGPKNLNGMIYGCHSAANERTNWIDAKGSCRTPIQDHHTQFARQNAHHENDAIRPTEYLSCVAAKTP